MSCRTVTNIAGMQAAAATTHFFADRYDVASAWAERLLREYPASRPGLRIVAASNAMAGRPEQAHKAAVTRLRHLDRALRVSNLRDFLGPCRHTEDHSRYEDGMRQAGVPE
jgi:hypothetical protein